MSPRIFSLLESPALCSFFDLEAPFPDTIPADLEAFLARLHLIRFSPDDVIVIEGEVGDAVYIVDSGEATVTKKSGSSESIIGKVIAGDIVGELALFTDSTRAATVRAYTEVVAFRISKQDFDELIQMYPHISGTFLRRLYNRLTHSYQELEQQNRQLETLNHYRSELSSIFTMVVLVMSVYSFALEIFQSTLLSDTIKFWGNRFIEIISLLVIMRIIHNSKLSVTDFGVTWTGAARAYKEALCVSIGVILLLTGLKVVTLTYGWISFSDHSIISFSYFNWTYITYLIVAPLQELIGRGVIQSSIQRLLTGKRATFWAILITSFLFGALHLHTSLALGTAALISSLLWGALFARHGTLVGVSLSHFLIGNWVGLLGFWDIVLT
ncbi:cyclic nucleotide-binding domain-containing protein [Aneurinibacillus uraniidurans]|uniref:cyclic nucleotide-binding domain-containing protein n=1 Tax=Aneurinibacillus uraniidurans TaxID=2966586 RepID=UPI002349D4D9|nr:cyclic nucleotide-binding domain-containing protein [Aneurinibacillus sp. B1]WCN37929.1 cyclic nucleotide-binding domain-containing protein [Aneurinibacillus sp. B1]